MNNLPWQNREQADLEGGNQNSSNSVELTTSASPSLAPLYNHEDDNVGEESTVSNNDHFDDSGSPFRDQSDESHTLASEETDSMMPLTSTVVDES